MNKLYINEPVSLTNTPPGPLQRRVALIVIAVSLITLALFAPLARHPLARIVAFIPAYESALSLSDAITAILLFGHFWRTRSLAVLILGCGYLFDALIVIPHALTFPNVFAPEGLLGAGPQTTAWLYCFWHGGFALFVIAYAATSRQDAPIKSIQRASLIGIVGVAILVLSLIVVATSGQQLLTPIMNGADYSMLVTKGISPVIAALSLLAIGLLWRRRMASTLDLWLFVVMWAWLCDVMLSAVIGSGRYDLGWYAGRSYGLMAACFLLGALLLELQGLYGRLAERTAQLQSNAEQLRAIFETTHLYQSLLSVDGTVLHANMTALNGIDAKLADVVGRKFWHAPWFTSTEGMPAIVQKSFLAVAVCGAVRTEMQLDLPRGTRAFDFSMRAIAGADGVITAIATEAVDITERLRSEEALRQSQKMEAIGQLTGGLAHDFNNLLAGIMGSLDLLQTRMNQGRTGELGRYIATANGAAQRAAALTHRLLSFSRRQTLEPQPMNVNQLAAGLEDLIRRTVGPSIDIQVVGAAGLWVTMVDKHQLENALLNLCINARDAMPDGGKLTIETANRWIDQRTSAEREITAGQYVSLCVSDTGTGMSADVIARAFDPFFTTKPLGMGTGLGLSMTYGFAKQSGGHVRIYSEIGQGTTVCIYLPRQDGAEKLIELEKPQDAFPAATTGKTVLVVDDEPSVRMLVAEVLEEQGYHTIEATTGSAGLTIIQSNAEIDLLVTDVGLPGGMNGRQLADAAKIQRPDLKILFITGYAENAMLRAGDLIPHMEVMTKPFALSDLAARINLLLS